MDREYLLKEHADIFEHLDEYALVKTIYNNKPDFIIIYKATMGFVLIEEYSEDVKKIMIEMGVEIADSKDQITPPDFKPAHLIWDEEKQEWRKVYEDEIAKMMEEKAKKRTDR
jgi:hypothetical protein